MAPATPQDEIAIIRELVKEFPVTGICLGHQLIGHALGGTTAKLKFGHHGCNHPVKDLGTGRIEISSQNHGFHVVLDGLDDVEATHINLNDQTLEGLRHKTLPVMSVQYHPEAAAGPHDDEGRSGLEIPGLRRGSSSPSPARVVERIGDRALPVREGPCFFVVEGRDSDGCAGMDLRQKGRGAPGNAENIRPGIAADESS